MSHLLSDGTFFTEGDKMSRQEDTGLDKHQNEKMVYEPLIVLVVFIIILFFFVG